MKKNDLRKKMMLAESINNSKGKDNFYHNPYLESNNATTVGHRKNDNNYPQEYKKDEVPPYLEGIYHKDITSFM